MSRRRAVIRTIFLAALLAGCESREHSEGESRMSLEELCASGELVVLTRNAPTTYYQGRDGLAGFEYSLTQELAESLAVTPRYEVYETLAEILSAIEEGKGHIAAAGLTRTEGREARLLFGPDYQTVQQQVICHRNDERPKTVADLVGRTLVVVAGSSYEERLHELQAEVPDLAWTSTGEASTEQILERVWRREVDCTVADSNIVAINRRYFPELDIAFALTDEQPLAWVIRPGGEELQAFLNDWVDGLERSNTLEALHHRYYGHVAIFDYVDTRRYLRRIESRLPKYRPLFEQAARQQGVDWTLLAAQAYQESHWDPTARSPTGVRGLMMLARPTAAEVGVENRLDPRQSIMGGAQYLAGLLERVPDTVKGEDRVWFALAAYNVGMGHLYDARTLARRMGRDPDVWHELRLVLPLLSRKRYYRDLRYGYARGTEPVRYVRRIRHYRDILEQQVSASRHRRGDGSHGAAAWHEGKTGSGTQLTQHRDTGLI